MDSNLALSRKEKEELVLDLYFNQNKNYHQITQEARILSSRYRRDCKQGVERTAIVSLLTGSSERSC